MKNNIVLEAISIKYDVPLDKIHAAFELYRSLDMVEVYAELYKNIRMSESSKVSYMAKANIHYNWLLQQN